MGNIGITPTTFQITSTDQIQSALWVGTIGGIEVTKVTQFKNTDVYFSTTVTIKNVGTSNVSNLYCKLLSFFSFFCLFDCFSSLHSPLTPPIPLPSKSQI